MRKRLARFSPAQTAATVAAFYFFIGVIVWLIAAIVTLFRTKEPGIAEVGVVVGGLLAIFIYAIIAFIGTVLTVWLYNLAAKWTGGIEITLKDSED